MIRFLLPLLLAPLLSATAARADALKGPPDFQSFALGSTLAEVRDKGHPDKEPGDDIRLVCTGDPLAREAGLALAPEPEMAKIGIKLCIFARQDGNTLSDGARMRFGRHKFLIAFYFTPRTRDPATSERLYRMGTIFAPALLDDLTAALRSRYGAPDVDKIIPVRTKQGTPRDAKRLIWQGGPYSIMVQDYVDGLEDGAFGYFDNDTLQALNRQAKDGTGMTGTTGTAAAAAPPSASASTPFFKPLPNEPAAAPARPRLSPSPYAAQALPEPLDVRGIDLGTTLADLRRQGHPDAPADDVVLICSGDPLAAAIGLALPPDSAHRRIGTQLCLFNKMAGDKAGEMPFKVGGHAARVTFFITPKSADPAFSERVYGVHVAPTEASFDDMAAVNLSWYGPPNAQESKPARNMMWQNRSAMLVLGEQPGNRASALYYDRKLNDAVEALIEKKTESGAAASTAAPPPPTLAPAPAARAAPAAPDTAASSMKLLPDSVGLLGFTLGAPLADLRRQKYPGASPGEVRLICSGDALSKEAALNFPPSEVAGQIGIKMCRFYTVAGTRVREAPLKVAGHDTRAVFFVTPPSADLAFSERLYGIRIEAKGAPFADFAAAYTTEFGKPANPEGVSPRDLMWLNLRARLLLKDDPRDGVSVLYYDTELQRAVEVLKTRKSKSGADKL